MMSLGSILEDLRKIKEFTQDELYAELKEVFIEASVNRKYGLAFNSEPKIGYKRIGKLEAGAKPNKDELMAYELLLFNRRLNLLENATSIEWLKEKTESLGVQWPGKGLYTGWSRKLLKVPSGISNEAQRVFLELKQYGYSETTVEIGDEVCRDAAAGIWQIIT